MSFYAVVYPFHVVDPVDRVGARCDDEKCTRAKNHPGPHRSVEWDGSGHPVANRFWWAS